MAPVARPSSPLVLRLVYALVASVVTGLVFAGLAFPVVGGLGLTAKAGADEFLVLPAELEETPLAQRSKILASDGSLLAILYRENRVLAELRYIPDLTQKAFIAVEDARFYRHNGVDYKGTLRAALENAQAGGVSQGGSTLTQQYVKNALLQAASTKAGQSAATEVTLDRKLKEARYALAIERKLNDKDEILERYLNIAYFGNGAYGIGTAANFYFGKFAKDLTLEEGALLAGIVQSPGRFDPVKARKDPALMKQLLDRRNIVLRRMALEGYITEIQRAQGTAVAPAFRISPVVSGCENPEVKAPFFCDYVRRTLEDTDLAPELGTTREQRQNALLAGGLTIKTTLDPVVQAAAQTAADERNPRDDPYQAATAINSVEPGTGDIKAMAVNRFFSEQDKPGHTKVNLAIGGSSGMQAGSTFKPFVLTSALQQGIPLSRSYYAPNDFCSEEFENYVDGRPEPYCPKNAGDSRTGGGTFDLRSGTWNSVNTFYVKLEEQTGVEQPAALAESLGVRQFKDGKPSDKLLRGGAFTLGANEVSPLAMAGAYASFAARGLYCPPRAVTEVLDAKGEPVELTSEPCRQVVEQEVADTVNDVLTGVIEKGTGTKARIGRPAAGKTGSTNGSRAAWFAGYTPDLATTVWVGKPQPEDMRFVRIGGRYYNQVYGGTLPAQTWQQMMRAALEGVPPTRFAAADPSVARGLDVGVPDVTGLRYDDAVEVLTEAGFRIRNGGRVPAAPLRRGRVAYTSPRAGAEVKTGERITIFTSSGRERQAPAPAPAPAEPVPAEPVAEPVEAEPAGQQEPAQPEPGPSKSGKGKGKG